jgi:DNA ligase-4
MEDALEFIQDGSSRTDRVTASQPPPTKKETKVPRSHCEDNCNKLLFKDICERFERVNKTSGTDKKFKAFFDRWMKEKIDGQSIFPVMRLLLPLNDNERGKYLLKQATVSRLYVNVLNLDKKHSSAAQSLINWKDPTKVMGMSGDFGAVLDHVLATRARIEPSNCTVGEVNEILDSLAAAHGEAEKSAVIRERIYPRFCSNEQKWLMRIVFQDMKIGLKHDAVLSRLSPTALQRYNQCTNLRTVCEEEGSGIG